MLSKREPKPKKERTETPRKATGRGSGGTYGRSLATKAGTLALLFCVVSGPLALLGSCTPRQAVVQAQAAPQTGSSSQEQSTGAYALGFVTSWLSATREQPGELSTYVDVRGIEPNLSEEPWTYRDAALVSVDVDETARVATVVISASVLENVYSSEDKPTQTWPRRYFQVPVSFTEVGMRVLALPTPLTPPEQSKPAMSAYRERLTETTPVGASVRDFLAAYLTDSGDITRFVTPGAPITAIAPALFEQIVTTELTSVEAAPQSPGDGDTLHVLATVTAANVDSRVLTSVYALTVVARAGRWEISSIDTAPQIVPSDSGESAPTPTTTATPSPTGAGTSEGENE